MFDDDKSGTISKSEMLDGLFLLNEGTKEDKIRFFFDVYDLNSKLFTFLKVVYLGVVGKGRGGGREPEKNPL